MSRATRRHPDRGRRQRRGRPAVPRQAQAVASGPARAAPEGRGLGGLLRPRWAEDIVSELRKVTWPSREDTWYLTVVVLIVATAFGVFLGGIDLLFNWAIDKTLLN